MSTSGNSTSVPTLNGRPIYYISDPSVSGALIWFGIACAITLATVLLYEGIRRRPGLTRVLYTRTETNRRESPPLPRDLFGWVKPVWQLPEDYIAENVGLDAVMFLRFLRMCFVIICVLMCFLLPILLPVNYYGGRTNATDAANSLNSTNAVFKFGTANLEFYSFGNIPEASSFLWAHIICAYAVSFVCYYFMFLDYRAYAHIASHYIHGGIGMGNEFNKRVPAWRRGELVQLRTLLVQNIPPELQTDDKLKQYFEELELGDVERATMDRDPGNKVSKIAKSRQETLKVLEREYVEWLLNIDAERDKRKGKGRRRYYTPGNLLRLQAAPLNLQDMGIDELGLARLRPKRRARRRNRKARKKNDATWSLSLGKDEIDHYTQKLKDLTIQLKQLRRVGLGDTQPIYIAEKDIAINAAGFVTFKTQRSAQMVVQLLLHSSDSYFPMSVTLAPAVQDVIWENISQPAWRRFLQSWIITAVCLFLIFLWALPTSAIASFTSLKSLAKVPAFQGAVAKLASYPRLSALVQSIGPPLIVNICNLVVPYLFEFLSEYQGLPSRSGVELATMSKYWTFLFFNTFLVFMIAQTVIKVAGDFIKNPISIVNTAVDYLPSAASFFINYVLLNLLLFPIELLRPGIMIIQLVGRWVCKTPRDFHELSIFSSSLNYGILYPIHVLIFVIVICYSTIAPLILIPGASYFAVGWFVYRNQMLFVYVKEWESYGHHFVMAFHRCTVGLAVYQVLLCGLLALRKAPTPSALCVPLIVFTLLFHLYCRRVFQKRAYLVPLDLFTAEAKSEAVRTSSSHLEAGSTSALSTDPRLQTVSHQTNLSASIQDSMDFLNQSTNENLEVPPSATIPDYPAMDVVTNAEQQAQDRYPTSYANPIFSKPMPRPWLPVSMAAVWSLPSRVLEPRKEVGGAGDDPQEESQKSRGIPMEEMDRTHERGSYGVREEGEGKEVMDDGTSVSIKVRSRSFLETASNLGSVNTTANGRDGIVVEEDGEEEDGEEVPPEMVPITHAEGAFLEVHTEDTQHQQQHHRRNQLDIEEGGGTGNTGGNGNGNEIVPSQSFGSVDLMVPSGSTDSMANLVG
ncbi:hypothetical protein HKX48_000130 [Thoreauomyces humboldtii]|nr:hypothetical protein HKX48_000130 [Thoreauomyces humboldtii]